MVLVLSSTFMACKKEKIEEPPAFSAEGYWRGQTYLYSVAILNKGNGKSRLYFRIPGVDTAGAESKLDGNYTTTQNGIRATYYFPNTTGHFLLETYSASQNIITGLLVYQTGEATTFDLRRQ